MKAVILAGGYGKRLRPFTDSRPKPMVEVGNRPIVEWQLLWLKSMGIDSFVVLTGYLSNVLIKHVDGIKRKMGVEVKYSVEKKPLGTGGALRQAERLLDGEDSFVMVNGDNITNINIGKMKLNSCTAALALVPLRSPYGVARLRKDMLIGFDEKPLLTNYWINAGVYLFSSSVFDYLPSKGDLEKSVFPELSWKNMLRGVKFKGVYWHGVDTIKDMEEVSRELLKREVIKQNP